MAGMVAGIWELRIGWFLKRSYSSYLLINPGLKKGMFLSLKAEKNWILFISSSDFRKGIRLYTRSGYGAVILSHKLFSGLKVNPSIESSRTPSSVKIKLIPLSE